MTLTVSGSSDKEENVHCDHEGKENSRRCKRREAGCQTRVSKRVTEGVGRLPTANIIEKNRKDAHLLFDILVSLLQLRLVY